jgi:hypothetical protein
MGDRRGDLAAGGDRHWPMRSNETETESEVYFGGPCVARTVHNPAFDFNDAAIPFGINYAPTTAFWYSFAASGRPIA